ncbi:MULTISPECIES: hypothetical protein [unclassified Bradyrhizobium]|uniref:hypothetical protein n=1 Tax=unclassified Bradyrhizobium TaxID=2631580 RepID=UPI0029170487|nr:MULTISPECIES: hypothetical protein [unclassified Bradyrhizobium]
MQDFWKRCLLPRDHVRRIVHSHAFHTSHGVAHAAYFCAVMAEGHGFYAVIGGVMVVYSFITVIAAEDQ